jgi:NlpC/P60 family
MIGPPAPRRPASGGGLAVLVVVTVLAALAAPHAQALRGLVAGGLPVPTSPVAPAAPATRRPSARAARAVDFALRQRGKPYQWGAEGPHAYDCSGLTWAAWRAAGLASPGPRPANSPASPKCVAGSSPATCSSTTRRSARQAGMWPW